MKNADVHVPVLAEVITSLPTRFRTRAVSEDPRVLITHMGVEGGELNAAIGRVLSSQRGRLGIELLDASQSNAWWRRVGSGPV